jgi:hypothetical protein
VATSSVSPPCIECEAHVLDIGRHDGDVGTHEVLLEKHSPLVTVASFDDESTLDARHR